MCLCRFIGASALCCFRSLSIWNAPKTCVCSRGIEFHREFSYQQKVENGIVYGVPPTLVQAVPRMLLLALLRALVLEMTLVLLLLLLPVLVLSMAVSMHTQPALTECPPGLSPQQHWRPHTRLNAAHMHTRTRAHSRGCHGSHLRPPLPH